MDTEVSIKGIGRGRKRWAIPLVVAERIKEMLLKLPVKKERQLEMKELCVFLYQPVQTALEKGYSPTDIIELFRECGCDISDTGKNYYWKITSKLAKTSQPDSSAIVSGDTVPQNGQDSAVSNGINGTDTASDEDKKEHKTVAHNSVKEHEKKSESVKAPAEHDTKTASVEHPQKTVEAKAAASVETVRKSHFVLEPDSDDL